MAFPRTIPFADGVDTASAATLNDLEARAKVYIDATGGSGGGLADWVAGKAYTQGQAVSQGGLIWKAAWAHTSGSVFNPNNWVPLDLPYSPFVNPYSGRIGFATNMRSRTTAQRTQIAARAASIGATWVREVISWSSVQAVNSVTFDWSVPDAVVTIAANAGLTVLPLITSTPFWASLTSDYNVPPINNSDYANFCLVVWQRYGVGGAFWSANPGLPQLPSPWLELWNEPWGGIAQKYQTDTVSVGGATGGSFTYSFTWQGRVYTTPSIAFNASPATVQTALNAATSGGTALPSGATWRTNALQALATGLGCSTQGTLSGPITGQTINSSLTGGTPVVTAGSAGVPPFQVDSITLGGATGGSFVYSFSWQGRTYTTALIAWNATNATLTAALAAATTSGGVGLPPNTPFAVTAGPLPASVTVTAQNALNGPITGQSIDASSLTGGSPATGTLVTGVQFSFNTGFFHNDGSNAPTYPAGGSDPIKYAAMIAAAGTLMRSSAPTAKLLFSGDVYSEDSTVGTTPFFAPILAAQPTLISSNLFDGITIHPYTVAREFGPYEQDAQGSTAALLDPQGRFDRIRLSQRLLDTNGASGKEVWMTELGWSTDTGGFSNSEDLQAQFTVDACRRVFREYGSARESNPATRVFIYTLDDYLTGAAGSNDNNVLKYPGAPSTPGIAKRVVPALRKLIVAGDGLRRLQDEMLADNPCFMLSLDQPSTTIRDLSGNMPLLNPLAATAGLVNSPAVANAIPGIQYQGTPGVDLTFGGGPLISDPRAYSLLLPTGAGGILIDDHPALNLPTTQLALEAWVKVNSVSGTSTIFRKFGQYQLTAAGAGGGYGLSFGVFGGGAVYHVFQLTPGDRTGGTYTATFKWNGLQYTTPSFPFNATLAQIAAAFNAATTTAGQLIPAGIFAFSGGPLGAGGANVIITTTGLGTGLFSSLGVTNNGTGGTTTPALTTTTSGALGTNTFMATNVSTEIQSLGSIHHVVGVWDGQLMKIYVDGRKSVNVPAPIAGAIPVSAQPLGIGYRGAAAVDFLLGNLSHIAIYPRPLREKRIAEHYQAGASLMALA